MAYKLSRLLEIIGDGKWHEIAQVGCSADLTDAELHEIKNFLGTYDFAEIDETKGRIKLTKDFQKICCQPT